MYRRAAREAGIILLVAVLLGVSYSLVAGKGLFAGTTSPVASYHGPTGPAPSPITLAEAKALFDAHQATFVDARHPFDFRRGHISTAVNIPLTELDSMGNAVAALPQDRVIVVYCDGSECNSSIELAAKLYEEGVGNIRIFFGGWEEWSQHNYPTQSTP